MDWNKVINWDEVPEDVVICKDKAKNALFWGHDGIWTSADCLEEIKRPIKLEDGAWYAYTVGVVKKAGVFSKDSDTLSYGITYYYVSDCKIHKKLPDDMWE